jgi:uncharacterized protein DUF6883
MKLPNAHLAVVERQKIIEYLLNPGHRYGASKARFFAQFGFGFESCTILAAALREHGQRPVSQEDERDRTARRLRFWSNQDKDSVAERERIEHSSTRSTSRQRF